MSDTVFRAIEVEDKNVGNIQVYTSLAEGKITGKIGMFFQTNRPIAEIADFQSSKIGLTGHNFYVQLTPIEAANIIAYLQECLDAVDK